MLNFQPCNNTVDALAMFVSKCEVTFFEKACAHSEHINPMPFFYYVTSMCLCSFDVAVIVCACHCVFVVCICACVCFVFFFGGRVGY